jgi:hypothetical protein
VYVCVCVRVCVCGVVPEEDDSAGRDEVHAGLQGRYAGVLRVSAVELPNLK